MARRLATAAVLWVLVGLGEAVHGATPEDLGWNDLSGIPPLPASEAFPIEKIQASDARSTRGFFWGALDGTIHTRRYTGHNWEWPQRVNGVGYASGSDRSLHVSLSHQPFNYLFLRGGFTGDLRTGVTVDLPPWDGQLVHPVVSTDEHHRWFPQSAQSHDRLSLVATPGEESRISDVQLFRVGNVAVDEPFATTTGYYVSNDSPPPLDEFIAARFDASDQTVFALSETPSAAYPQPEAYQFVHLATPPIEAGQNVSAVALNLQVTLAEAGDPVRVIVHDPLNPRLELLNVDVALSESGYLRLVLDVPDQVFSREGLRLWISLASRVSSPIKLINGLTPIEVRSREEADALAEYVPYRRALLRHQFQVLSEPRPWSDYATPESLENSNYTDLLIELRDTMVDLHTLVPDEPVVREYWEWVNPLRLSANELLHPINTSVPDIPAVPLWAELEHEVLQRLRDMISWWYDNRLIENGELGGDINDDTDFSGHVVNLAMLDSEISRPIIVDALDRLSDTIDADKLDRGLPIIERDALHFYEDGINLRGYMAYLQYGQPLAMERIMLTADSLMQLSGVNPAGHRHFRSNEYAAGHLDDPPPPSFENGHSLLFLHPTMMTAWYNRNVQTETFSREYLGAWLEHFGPDHYPQKIEFETDSDLVLANRVTRGGASVGHSFMMMQWWARENEWFYPFQLGFDSGDRAFDWEASFCDLFMRVDMSAWADSLLPYYRSYSDRDYASLLAWLLSGEKSDLENSLRASLELLMRYPWMYTEAEPYTDRVEFPHEYVSRIAMGGGCSRNEWFSTRAITFDGFGLNVASLVYDNDPDALRFALVNMLESPISGKVRLWQLDHGIYRLRIGPDEDDDGTLDSVETDAIYELARFDALPVILPPREVRLFVIEQIEPLDEIALRADLAVSADDISLNADADSLSVVVHNLGSSASGPFDVAIADAQGCVLTTQPAPSVEAPADLSPKTVEMTFEEVPPTGILVVLDPESAVAEITESNNRAAFREPVNCAGTDCDANGIADACETTPTGDHDIDCDVDLIDFAAMQACFTGPATIDLPACCGVFDFDADSDVDLDDFDAFVIAAQ